MEKTSKNRREKAWENKWGEVNKAKGGRRREVKGKRENMR